MICFSLRCGADHRFDSWFQSSDAFDRLAAEGRLTCAMCGGGGIEKALMAPTVATRGTVQTESAGGALSAPMSPQEAALAALRRHVEKNSEYVGMNFVTEARKMHEGGTPERAIHGEARPDEARRLIEDGVPVAPLPFLPMRKVN